MKIENQKAKGSQFEYSVRDSLAQRFPDVLLTKQEGFVRQYDIIVPSAKTVIECKKHSGFSWNELEKYFEKLKQKAGSGNYPYLVFQANRQPCLVMFEPVIFNSGRIIIKFEDVFKVPFINHKGQKKESDGGKNGR